MPIPEIAIALGSSIASAVLAESVETALAPFAEKARDALEKMLKLGKYEAIERALLGAKDDTLGKAPTSEFRQSSNQILDTLFQTKASSLLNEFTSLVVQTYLLPSTTSPDTQSIARVYRRVCGPVAVLAGTVPDEAMLTKLLDDFFLAFRERLLREEDFSFLREYFQLAEVREQTQVQQAMLNQLGKIADNTAPHNDDFTVTAQEYRAYLIRELKDHVIRGFAPQVGTRVLSLSLAKIFLPLQAVEGRPALAEYAEEDLRRQAASEVMGELDWQRRREEMEKRYAQLSARQAAQRPLTLGDLVKNSRSVLLGDPGTGKTTITRYVTYALAANDSTHIDASILGLTPVLVRIANFAKAYERDNTLHVIDYVEKGLNSRADFGRYLRHAIEVGECLVILDGLDEVTSPTLRIQVTDRIQEMVASYSNNKFMVTSRIVGYDVSPLTSEFKHATLKEMTPEDQERFVRLWYDAIKTEMSDSVQAEGADNLVEALRTKPQIARMGANPLLLTIIVLMHWRGLKLPNRRVQVYQNATDTLVEFWTKQRGVDLDAEDIKNTLAPIAHFILSSNVGGVIAHADLVPRFQVGIAEQRGCDLAEAKRISKEMLHDLNEQSGLFLERGKDQNDQPVYGFLHQTFGEYLAALYLAQEMLGNRFDLAQHIHRSMWHEPLLLLAGHLSIVSAAHANTLIRRILDFDAPYEEMLQRNLLLAADCLADDIQIKVELRDEVLEKLAQALQHPAPQVREAAVERYRRLGVTRHCEAAAAVLKRVYPVDQHKKLPDETQVSLLTALVHLGELTLAEPILQKLERERSWDYELRRLRFVGWQDNAADYMLELQTKKESRFYISPGATLSDCTLGPVNGELARRVLGKVKLLDVIDTLKTRVHGKETLANLNWIAALAAQPQSIESFVELTKPDASAQVRRLAAVRLLNTSHRSIAILVLRELAQQEPSQAALAARTLLESGEATHLNFQVLDEIALISTDASPEAISTLLQAKHFEIAVPAALLFLLSRPWNLEDHLAIIENLIQHGFQGLGYSAANWLSLAVHDSEIRLGACELLLDAGRIQQAIPLLQLLAYECHDENSQRACQRLLMLRETESIVPLLTHVASRSSPSVRYQACLALALANQAGHSATPISRREQTLICYEKHQRALNEAYKAFSRVGDQTLDKLGASDEQARSAQAFVRFRLKHAQESFIQSNDVNELYEFITSSSAAISVHAAVSILPSGNIEGIEQYLTRLVVDLFASRPVRSKAVTLLGGLVKPSIVKTMLQLLGEQDFVIRRSAVTALGNLGDPVAIQPLIAALADEDANVRRSAVTALGSLGDPAAIQPLIAALADEDANVRRSAVTALGNLGDPVAIQPLIAALADENEDVRSSAATALGSLGDPAAIQPLIAALADEDANVRSSVADALGRLGTVKISALLAILSATSASYAAQLIGLALVRLDPSIALPVLDRYAKQFRQESWQERLIGQAFAKLGQPDRALASLQKAVEKKNNVGNLLALAHFYLERDELQPALKYIDLVVSKERRSSICTLSQAVVLWKMGDTAQGLNKLRQAQKLDRTITRIKDLQYEHFWGPKAVTVLEEMLKPLGT